MRDILEPLLVALSGYVIGTWISHTFFDHTWIYRTFFEDENDGTPSVFAVADDDEELIVEERRDVSPSHFVVKIESFSLFSGHTFNKYETKEFEAGDYKWRLIIYPFGKENDSDYVSVYLAVAETCSLPVDWEFSAIFTIFLYNQKSDKYLCFQLKQARRFNKTKSEWGFPKFISKEILSDKSSGYLVDDSLVLGAEVFVLKTRRQQQQRVIDTMTVLSPSIYIGEWIIPEFSKVKNDWTSEVFEFKGFHWKMKLYRKGDSSSKDTFVKERLVCVCADSFAPHQKIKVNFYTRLIGKTPYTSITLASDELSHWFTSSKASCGTAFSSLNGLHNDFIDDRFIIRATICVTLCSH